jgi:hypothetical protein
LYHFSPRVRYFISYNIPGWPATGGGGKKIQPPYLPPLQKEEDEKLMNSSLESQWQRLGGGDKGTKIPLCPFLQGVNWVRKKIGMKTVIRGWMVGKDKRNKKESSGGGWE